MPKKSTIVKGNKKQKFSTREFKQCLECGRNAGLVCAKSFLLCRICLRRWIHNKMLPGWKKASW